MAHSRVLNTDSEKYPGPSQAELGSLADWVSEAEFSRLHAGSRPARATSTAPAPHPPLHRRRPERYSGPMAEELGDLAPWLFVPQPSRPAERSTDLHPETSIRAIESELWASETLAEANRSPPEPARPTTGVPGRNVLDSFFDQLDEIQAALRKRTPA